MRILVLTNYYPPYSVGGYEIACETTVNWLRKRGHQVQVLTSQSPDETPLAESHVLRSYDRIDYAKGSYRQKWQTEKKNYTLTLDTIQAFQPDLVYLWSQRLISLGPVYAVEKSKLPKVFEFGDFWPDSYLKPGLTPWIRRKIKERIPGLHGGSFKLDPVISVARWMGPEIQSKYHSQKVVFIPNGLDLPSQKTWPDWNAPLKALFLGRIDPEKGLHLALEALLQLKEQGQILELTVAGKGQADYLDFCRQFVSSHGLEKQVHFLGWQPDPAPLYAQHPLLLMPTTMREPFGLVIVEAMLRGLAVFAPDAYGPAEIIKHGETGILFQPGDSKSLAQALLEQLKFPERLQTIGKQAQADAFERFGVDKVKRQVEQVLLQEIEAQTCQAS
ncbi:MAG: glycosyltransferase family 4 protein [Candidatus Sericytochromatia bacterium]|nr:glycosyltransferase family 4 protein [Candidatus Sericytochromatia bacterium]